MRRGLSWCAADCASQALAEAEVQLSEVQAALAEKQKELAQVESRLEELGAQLASARERKGGLEVGGTQPGGSCMTWGSVAYVGCCITQVFLHIARCAV